MKKNKIIIVLVLVCILIGSLVYIGTTKFYVDTDEDYRYDVEIAKEFYNKSDYANAYNWIQDYTAHPSDKDFFEKVDLLGTIDHSYKVFYRIVDQTAIDPSNIKTSLEALIDSITISTENKTKAVEFGIENELAELKNKLLTDLELHFKANKQDISDLINLDEDEKEAKINRLVEVKINSMKETSRLKKVTKEKESEVEKNKKLKQEVEQTKLEQEDIENTFNTISPLNIEDISLVFEDNYMYFTGFVKNTGDRSYRYIKIKAIYYDGSDNIIDTDWTYAVGSEGLAPNERKSFKIMTRRTNSITKGNVSILDYQ